MIIFVLNCEENYMIKLKIGHFCFFGSNGKALMIIEFNEFAEWMTKTGAFCLAGKWYLPNPKGRNIIKTFDSYEDIRKYYLRHKNTI